MAGEDIVIRAQEPEDLAALAEVYNQPRVVWGTLQTPFTGVAQRRERYGSPPESHSRLVAVIGGKVIGSAGLHPGRHRRRQHAAELGMGVHDAYAGHGVGRALMAAVIDLADNWLAYRRLELTVWTDNDRAIRLYESFGFEREGVHRAYAWREGGYVDALAMARLRL